MDQMLVLLPLALTLVVLSWLVRLAGRIAGKISVTWKHAALYAVITVLANALIRSAVLVSGVPFPAILFPILSLAFQLTLGALFFAQRAKTAEGQPVGARGGLKISGVVFAIMATVAGLFWLVVPA